MKRSKSPKPPKGLFDTISYFAFFSFPPDFDQIFTFLPEKTGKNELVKMLARLQKEKKIISASIPGQNHAQKQAQYTLPQYRMHFQNRALRGYVTKKKLAGIKRYLRALSLLPVIQFAGVTGSASMQNCNETDDVDLCIVTSPNLLFTGRFLAILLSKLLRVRRPVDGACLNLFFDARDLVIPEKKRTPYVAHELLQMKPVIEKGVTYQTFRQSNRWVLDIYPNAGVPQGQPHEMSAGVISLLLQPVEQILKAIELRIIRKNRTGHLITGTQLWLFRKDFGEKLRIKR